MQVPKPVPESKLLPILMALITIIIVVVALLPYGDLRQTYDSHDLMSASESLDTYLTGKNSDGYSYLVRAPLHPFILSFFDNKVVALWWINLFCLFASATLIYALCFELIFSKLTSALTVFVVVSFCPWLMNFQFFWTEQVFIVLILCLCISLIRQHHIVVVLALCLLLFLTRKPGIFFFVSVAMFYAVDRKFARAGIVFASAFITFILWQWLEYYFGSTGHFGLMLETLDEYYRIYYLDAVTSWFLPMAIPLVWRSLLLLTFFLTGFFYFRNEIFSFFQVKQNLVLLLVAGGYSVVFICFTGASGYEDAERYLNVVFPLLIILLAGIARKVYLENSPGVRIAVLLSGCLWFLYSFSRTVHHLL